MFCIQRSRADLRWRQVTIPLLRPGSIIKLNVSGNRFAERNFIVEFEEIVHLCFQDAPEPLRRTVINAVTNTGHGLLHALGQKLCLKHLACVLKSPVTVEDRLGVRVGSDRLLEGIEDQLVVIPGA